MVNGYHRSIVINAAKSDAKSNMLSCPYIPLNMWGNSRVKPVWLGLEKTLNDISLWSLGFQSSLI